MIVEEKGLVLFCLPELSSIEERYSKRNFEQQIKFEELEKSYNFFVDELKPHHIIYRSKNFEELAELVNKIVEGEL